MQSTAELERKRPKCKDDAEALECDHPGCAVKFGMRKRRFHCKGCGFAYCKEHLTATMKIPAFGYSTPVPVCQTCLTHGVDDGDDPIKHNAGLPKEKVKKEKKEKKPAKEKAEKPKAKEKAKDKKKPLGKAAKKPADEVAALQEKVQALEARLQSEKTRNDSTANLPPRSEHPPVIFRDEKERNVSIKPHSRGRFVCSVDNQDYPPFSVLCFIPEGPGLELKDIQTTLTLAHDCRSIVERLAVAADAEGVEHNLSTRWFCPSCGQLLALTPFCGYTGTAHVMPPPVGSDLPAVTNLSHSGALVVVPQQDESSDSSSWSSGDGNWGTGAGAAVAQAAPQQYYAAAAVAYQPQYDQAAVQGYQPYANNSGGGYVAYAAAPAAALTQPSRQRSGDDFWSSSSSD
ncbi:putative zinc finger protein [Diplonema papillatum]|nr:putative zinc finger protein [Diplonema papillatum]|eukprot:gene4503-6975_t